MTNVKNKLAEISKNDFLKKIEQGVSITQLAKDFGVTRSAIYQKFKRIGLKSNTQFKDVNRKWRFPVERAESLLTKYTFKKAPIDILKVASEEGLVIVFEELDKKLSGMYLNEKIIVNKTLSEARIRFTIAYELGHYILNHEMSELIPARMIMNTGGSESHEIEASRFAAALLMPHALLKKDLQKIKEVNEDDIQRLADKYKVTPISMTMHLLQTKLISE
ncbi:ImmA/IrrE family metallo-endopeptidase [bacterium]|jgi:Zn-dependent peptidase ImmA (M78 family)|nr:ImmA/IrrE family metallo-endopeptidase [bacterium]